MKIFFGLFLVFAPSLIVAQPQIFYNAKIFTANPQKPYAEAIAISGKKITAVGIFEEVKQKAGSKAILTSKKIQRR